MNAINLHIEANGNAKGNKPEFSFMNWCYNAYKMYKRKESFILFYHRICLSMI